MPKAPAFNEPGVGGRAWPGLVLKGLAWAGLLALLALAATAIQAAPGLAPLVVNDASDLPGLPPLTSTHCAASNGKCTLRAAIMVANQTAGGLTIILPAGTYTLTIPAAFGDRDTTGDLNISSTVTLRGAGASSTSINANGGVIHDRAFFVQLGAALNLSGVTIRGGMSAGNGGGIYNAGVLSLDSSALIGNFAGSPNGYGGALSTAGQAMTVTNSTLSGNIATGGGGAIQADFGSVTIVDSSIISNQASINGGGIDNGGATLSVTGSTIAGNTGYNGGGILSAQNTTTLVVASTISGNTAVTNAGGGLEENGGTANLVNSTLSGNSAAVNGGGISNDCPCASLVNLYNVTISNNQADADSNGSGDGGGVFNGNNGINTVQLQDSLIAGNWATQLFFHNIYILRANDCNGPLTSLDYDLIGTTSDCTFTKSPDDQLNVAADIGPLQANGGPTLTQALLPGSPAIDAGAPSGCPDQNSLLLATDQRGARRTANGAGTTRCDIGAFELQRVVYLPLARR